MARRRQSRISKMIVGATSGAYHASHTVPAVGFLFAALLGVGWWKLRPSASAAVQWLAMGLGIMAIFFAVVAAAGFGLNLLERKRRRR